MAEYTRPATWDDVLRIAGWFEESGVDYALLGGYALASHGLSRFTVDLDGVSLRVLDLEGLLETKRGVRPKDQADAALIERALAQLRQR